MNLSNRYYLRLAVAYILGEFPKIIDQFQTDIYLMDDEELTQIFKFGKDNGLKLHRFKRTIELPRVVKVIGILKGIQPLNLLDIGTGRGVFLNPFLDIFPNLPITCIDILDYRIDALNSLNKGGIKNLKPILMDVCNLEFDSESFEVVTALEVLEHITGIEFALNEICRVAKKYVVFSVPSKEDNNPEHVHLFTPNRLIELFHKHGFNKVKIDLVPNHIIGLALKNQSI
jgi:ubiquinone/menaquinone biosynthesis C-methylase UbiE